MFDCENCDLSAEQCICGKVDKFFRDNKHLMADYEQEDELAPRRQRKQQDNDFYLDEIG